MTEVFSALTGSGDVMLAVPKAVPLIGVSVTTFPQGAAVMDATSPRRVMKVGWFAPGRLGSDPSWPASLFFEDARWIDFERQLITYPTPGVYCDRIRYHLEPGAVADLYVNDTGVPAVPGATSDLQPWDRNAELYINSIQANDAGGTTTTSGLSYTVPTGQWLQLSVCKLRSRRTVVATSQGSGVPRSSLAFNSLAQLIIDLPGNLVGDVLSAEIASPVLLPAGTVIDWTHLNASDTGGTVNHRLSMVGLLFDA